MRVHFDIGHPAHVHLFKHAIWSLAGDGHTVAVTSREKEVTTDLLDAYDIEHTVLSRKRPGTLGTVTEWGLRELRTIRFARRFDPDVVVSRILPTSAHAATLADSACVIVNDTENVETMAKFTAPMIDYWCTPESYQDDYGEGHRRHAGVQELAYLHPNWFEADREGLREHGVDPDEPYFVLRFVSNEAYHDDNRQGIRTETKCALVDRLSERGTVYVSSEGDVPPELEANVVPVPPEDVLDLLAEANLMVTDSGTMATEAALLATPTVRYESPHEQGTLGAFVELESHGLIEQTTDQDEVERRALDLADSPDAEARWRATRDAYLEEATDVTRYMLDLVEEAAGYEERGDRQVREETVDD